MILTLKSATSDKIEEVAWSEDAADFLVRNGAILEEGSAGFVFLVEDPRAVRNELYRAGFI